MATEEGTGRHSHKSSEEPYPHHEAESTRGEHERSASGHSSATRSEGAHSGSSSRSEDSHSSRSERESSGSRSEGGRGESGSDSDLKAREYRDKEGNIHHHTHTAEAMQGGKSGNRNE